MSTYCILVFIVFISWNCSLLGQFSLSNWKSHTSLYEVNAITIDASSRLWCATNGGIYSYDTNTKKIVEFRLLEKLSALRYTSISYYAPSRTIIAGSDEGIIEFISEDDLSVLSNYDIKNSGFNNAQINSIIPIDNRVLISGGFGITIFDTDKNIFEEDVKRIGNFPTNTNIIKAINYSNKIYVGTSIGIGVSNILPSFANPSNWEIFDENDGLIGNSLLDFTIFEDTLYALSSNRIFKQVADSFEIIYNNSNEDIKHFIELNGKLCFSSKNKIFDVHDRTEITSFENIINNLFKLNNNSDEYFANIRLKGFFSVKQNIRNSINPSGPVNNYTSVLDHDDDGNIWAVSGAETGRGMMKYNGKEWINYNSSTTPVIRDDFNFFFINPRGGKKIRVGTKGSGAYIFEETAEGLKLEVLDKKNSPLQGILGTEFIMVKDMEYDSKGNLWIVNYGEGYENPEGKPLLVYKSINDEFQFFNNPQINSQQRWVEHLEIDSYGTKWVSSVSSGEGLYYFNDNNTPDNKSDDKIGIIKAKDYPNIVSDNQNCIKLDKDGALWIATNIGVSVIINPSSILSNPNNLIVRKLDRLVGTDLFRWVYVDALNNKWLAGLNDIIVLNSDASEVLAIINSSNSPLPVNEVLTITSNPKTGEMFFGTTKGIYSVLSLSAEPLTEYDCNVYPMPFNPEIDEVLTIEGLASDNDIKIITPDGRFVRKLTAGGSRAIWDGRNESGELVENGIYLAIFTSTSSDRVSMCKIALLKK